MHYSGGTMRDSMYLCGASPVGNGFVKVCDNWEDVFMTSYILKRKWVFLLI